MSTAPKKPTPKSDPETPKKGAGGRRAGSVMVQLIAPIRVGLASARAAWEAENPTVPITDGQLLGMAALSGFQVDGHLPDLDAPEASNE